VGHRTATEGYRVLIAAPYGRDAESLAGLLRRERYTPFVCADLTELAAATDQQAGVILLTSEALRDGMPALERVLDVQPAWSDIPVVVLAPLRATRSAAATFVPASLSNAIVLDRPIGAASLLSALALAMRSRQKQFETRDRLIELGRVREDLEQSETRLRLATEAAEIGFWDVDPIANTLFWPPLVRQMFGVTDNRPVSLTTFEEGLHPEDRKHVMIAFEAAADPEVRALYDVEYRTIGLDDKITRWVAAKGRGLFDDSGRCTRLVGTAIDISARKAAELELRALNETLEARVTERTGRLLQAEEALHQAQKMEAVGQLTGGIAHDFNNMLTGIIGSLDIMRRRIAKGQTEDLGRFMEAATQSAQRAASLTSRLLAFSRRQSLDSRPIEVNELVNSLADLLRRTMTERIDVSIVLGANLPPAIADPSQLESAILNLSINARDAMPESGALTIETSSAVLDEDYCKTHPDVTPGRYVVVAVSDTGVGIEPALLNKVFDPFFTTKPIGQGTGLGLSMIYGFAKQSKGQVRIHSMVGQGTSVKMYLPAGDSAALPVEETSLVAPQGAGQRVLMVEDDPSVRILVRDVLEELGYSVVEAKDANVAIDALSGAERFDLMVTDVGLPGMNGRQLAEIARGRFPDLPILFVTGYAENAAIRSGFLGTNMDMITKPFQIDALAAKINSILVRQPN
jgi:PAS domain S-box-containing protein